mmetsp:Transcript_136090/g.236494  ORF Transcript_136090/g.236494 Transcript_136090/m.236494 type:complete len:1284 (+) Transcript_136090:2-3853(+)
MRLRAGLMTLYQRQAHCDFELRVPVEAATEGEAMERVKVHHFILATCEKWRAKFEGHRFGDSDDGTATVDSRVLQKVLEFLYGGEIMVETPEEILPIYVVADEWQCGACTTAILDALREAMTPDMALRILTEYNNLPDLCGTAVENLEAESLPRQLAMSAAVAILNCQGNPSLRSQVAERLWWLGPEDTELLDLLPHGFSVVLYTFGQMREAEIEKQPNDAVMFTGPMTVLVKNCSRYSVNGLEQRSGFSDFGPSDFTINIPAKETWHIELLQNRSIYTISAQPQFQAEGVWHPDVVMAWANRARFALPIDSSLSVTTHSGLARFVALLDVILGSFDKAPEDLGVHILNLARHFNGSMTMWPSPEKIKSCAPVLKVAMSLGCVACEMLSSAPTQVLIDIANAHDSSNSHLFFSAFLFRRLDLFLGMSPEDTGKLNEAALRKLALAADDAAQLEQVVKLMDRSKQITTPKVPDDLRIVAIASYVAKLDRMPDCRIQALKELAVRIACATNKRASIAQLAEEVLSPHKQSEPFMTACVTRCLAHMLKDNAIPHLPTFVMDRCMAYGDLVRPAPATLIWCPSLALSLTNDEAYDGSVCSSSFQMAGAKDWCLKLVPKPSAVRRLDEDCGSPLARAHSPLRTASPVRSPLSACSPHRSEVGSESSSKPTMCLEGPVIANVATVKCKVTIGDQSIELASMFDKIKGTMRWVADMWLLPGTMLGAGLWAGGVSSPASSPTCQTSLSPCIAPPLVIKVEILELQLGSENLPLPGQDLDISSCYGEAAAPLDLEIRLARLVEWAPDVQHLLDCTALAAATPEILEEAMVSALRPVSVLPALLDSSSFGHLDEKVQKLLNVAVRRRAGQMTAALLEDDDAKKFSAEVLGDICGYAKFHAGINEERDVQEGICKWALAQEDEVVALTELAAAVPPHVTWLDPVVTKRFSRLSAADAVQYVRRLPSTTKAFATERLQAIINSVGRYVLQDWFQLSVEDIATACCECRVPDACLLTWVRRQTEPVSSLKKLQHVLRDRRASEGRFDLRHTLIGYLQELDLENQVVECLAWSEDEQCAEAALKVLRDRASDGSLAAVAQWAQASPKILAKVLNGMPNPELAVNSWIEKNPSSALFKLIRHAGCTSFFDLVVSAAEKLFCSTDGSLHGQLDVSKATCDELRQRTSQLLVTLEHTQREEKEAKHKVAEMEVKLSAVSGQVKASQEECALREKALLDEAAANADERIRVITAELQQQACAERANTADLIRELRKRSQELELALQGAHAKLEVVRSVILE